jgi:hypothetical protein
LAFHDSAGHRRLGFQQGCDRLNFYRFGNVTQFQLDVDTRLVIGAQFDAVADVLLETSGLDAQVLYARAQVRDVVIAILVGYALEVEVRPGIDDGDLRSRHDRAAAVGDRADDCGRSSGLP